MVRPRKLDKFVGVRPTDRGRRSAPDMVAPGPPETMFVAERWPLNGDELDKAMRLHCHSCNSEITKNNPGCMMKAYGLILDSKCLRELVDMLEVTHAG